MQTECVPGALAFQGVAGREVLARFDGGTLTSDGGAVLLREVDRATNLLGQFAACFTDHRDPTRVTHPVASLVRQRVYGLALGYEDLNDHDALRHDPLIAVLAESGDLAAPGAGKSTLNRLEPTGTTVGEKARYKKITVDHDAVDRLFVDVFVQAHATAPAEIILDLDATDDPIHGMQEGRFFHGYYGHYCYLPLYIFAGEQAARSLHPARPRESKRAMDVVLPRPQHRETRPRGLRRVASTAERAAVRVIPRGTVDQRALLPSSAHRGDHENHRRRPATAKSPYSTASTLAFSCQRTT